MRPFAFLSLLAALLAFAPVALRAGQAGGTNVSPEETMKTFKIPDGLEVTLVAAEPNIVNPTNMDIDEKGRIWIVEGANYRGKNKIRPEGDRVVICEDSDGDGVMDKFTTFYQDPTLICPLGIAVIGDKVYVSQSPKMMVFTMDETGTKPKGPPEILFQGFSGYNHDHGLHSAMFGADGRLYFNSGNSGVTGENFGKTPEGWVADAIIRNGKGEEVVDTTGSHAYPKGNKWRGGVKGPGQGYRQGMAFRCNMDGTGFEVLGHNFRNNYELQADSFCTVWQSDNDDDGNQGVRLNYVMEGGDFGYTGPGGWGQDVMRYPTQSQQEAHWHQRQPGIIPNLYNTGGGSPCGVAVYEGDLFGPSFMGGILHVNAGGQWYGYLGLFKPTANAAGFKCELTELAKNDDKFFKPSDVCVGPDGAIYFCDWYDGQSGGHGMTDDKPGMQKGRVYRLAPKGFKATKPVLELGTVEGQIKALCSPNNATRYQGYSKLVAGGEPAQKALQNLYTVAPNSRLKARALWALARLGDGKAAVSAALADKDADIRVTAVRAARMLNMDMISIANQLIKDENFAVLRELAIAMTYQPTDKALDVLVALADRVDPTAPESPVYDPKVRGKSMEKLAEENKERLERVTNRWYLEAVGIGAIGREKELLAAWEAKGANKGNAKLADLLKWRLNKVIAEAPPKEPKK